MKIKDLKMSHLTCTKRGAFPEHFVAFAVWQTGGLRGSFWWHCDNNAGSTARSQSLRQSSSSGLVEETLLNSTLCLWH